jgi:hypothetical protein
LKLFFILFALLVTTPTLAQSHIFTGDGGTTDWHTTLNWNANSVPSNTSTVLIPDGFEVNINATATSQALTLSGSGTLTLEATLSVSEIFSIENVAVFSFENGDLSAGTIENNGTMRFSNPEFKTIANTIINNHSQMNFINSNIVNLSGTVTINNDIEGTMDILANGGLTQENGAAATLINDGVVRKYTEDGDFGSFYMILDVVNNHIIEIAEDSQYLFLTPNVSFHNTSTGILAGTGVFDITSPFLNEGTVSPGGDAIGELRFINTFNLNGGVLEIDIESPTAFDTIVVTGSPDMEGSILLDVSYFPEDFNMSTILTSQFSITNCTFPSQIKYDTDDASFFVYEVVCNENALILDLVEIYFIRVDAYNDLSFSMTPNPINQEALITLNISQVNAPQLVIYSMAGKKVKTVLLDSNTTIFKRDSLADGVYFVQLVSEGKVISTEKIILQ